MYVLLNSLCRPNCVVSLQKYLWLRGWGLPEDRHKHIIFRFNFFFKIIFLFPHVGRKLFSVKRARVEISHENENLSKKVKDLSSPWNVSPISSSSSVEYVHYRIITSHQHMNWFSSPSTRRNTILLFFHTAQRTNDLLKKDPHFQKEAKNLLTLILFLLLTLYTIQKEYTHRKIGCYCYSTT